MTVFLRSWQISLCSSAWSLLDREEDVLEMLSLSALPITMYRELTHEASVAIKKVFLIKYFFLNHLLPCFCGHCWLDWSKSVQWWSGPVWFLLWSLEPEIRRIIASWVLVLQLKDPTSRVSARWLGWQRGTEMWRMGRKRRMSQERFQAEGWQEYLVLELHWV